MLPKTIEKFLWSSNINKLDLEKNKERIILNVLNLGDKTATNWLFGQYQQNDIKKTIINYGAKELSPKSLNYWQLILKIKSGKLVKCRF